MILVTSANGNQGKKLIPKLLAAGLPVRACVRSEESAAALRAQGVAEVLVGDLADPRFIVKAVGGVKKVYHVGPTVHPEEREMGMNLADAAKAEGVEHFVFSSVLHAISSDILQHAIKRDIEEHLLSSGLEFTILQPANYLYPPRIRTALSEGVFEIGWSPDRKQSFVDVSDVAEVTTLVLSESERHLGATYELVSEGRYTGYELAEIVSSVLDRPIPLKEIPLDSLVEHVFKRSDLAPDSHQVQVLHSIATRYSNHDFVGNPNVLTWLLGRKPTSFRQFVENEVAARSALSAS